MTKMKKVSESESPILHEMVARISRQAGIPKPTLYVVNDQTVFCVGNNGTIITAPHADSTWILMDSITTNNLTSVYFDHGVGYAVGDQGTILKSDDGNSWSVMESGIHYRLNSVAITESKNSFAVGYGGLILASNVDIDEWTTVNSGTLKTLYKAS